MVTMRFKMAFFNTKAVSDALDPVTREALAHAGAAIRMTARRSIRKRKSISKPGSPPSSHAGHLRRLLFYAFDRMAETVVVGPVPFKEGTAPATLEAGGSVTTRKTTLIRGEQGRNRSGHFTAGEWQRVPAGTRLTYRPRPFMGPALAKVEPRVAGFWAAARSKFGG